MTEANIKNAVKRYKIISTLWLSGFLAFAIFANYFLVQSNIDGHYAHGLEYSYSSQGFIWGAIILGLNVVLHLSFYSLEKILIVLHKENSSSS